MTDAPSSDEGGVVLVADDDEDIVSLIAFRLEKSGYEILKAADGEQALRLALERRPDLAILDVMMPKLTGLEVTERIRAAEGEAERMPIVLLTARVQESDIARGYEAGADDQIKKPFSPQDLRDKVQAILAERPHGGGPAR